MNQLSADNLNIWPVIVSGAVNRRDHFSDAQGEASSFPRPVIEHMKQALTKFQQEEGVTDSLRIEHLAAEISHAAAKVLNHPKLQKGVGQDIDKCAIQVINLTLEDHRGMKQ